MTNPTEKSQSLADWHELLSGTLIGGSLDAWHRALRHEVDQMKAAGLIDGGEAHELRELADAAHSHHVEDALTRELNQ